jgi:hypothetical protein
MFLGMLGQSQSCPGNGLVRDCLGAGTPALISVFVDVAVVTGEIAPAVDLQDDLAEWDQGSSHSASLERGVERRDALGTVAHGRQDPAELLGDGGFSHIDLGERNAILLRDSEGD